MKNLHFRDNIKNFLYDKEEAIAIYDNKLYIFNYLKLNKLSRDEIILTLEKYKLIVNGNDLKIKQMTKEELLILGIIKKVEFNYE